MVPPRARAQVSSASSNRLPTPARRASGATQNEYRLNSSAGSRYRAIFHWTTPSWARLGISTSARAHRASDYSSLVAFTRTLDQVEYYWDSSEDCGPGLTCKGIVRKRERIVLLVRSASAAVSYASDIPLGRADPADH